MTALLRLVRGARFRALLSLGMVLGLGAVGTLAAWSTSTTTTSGAFSTGFIDVQLNGSNATPYTVSLSPAILLPGQSTAVLIAVQNRGTVPFTYTAQANSSNAIGQALQLTARRGSLPTPVSVAGNACTGGASVASTPGIIGTGLTFGGTSGNIAEKTGNETLCLQFTLPSTAPNTLQSATGAVTLTFLATSV